MHCRDHFVHAPSQWEMMLHCNVVSYWLGAHTQWSMYWVCSIQYPDVCTHLQDVEALPTLPCGRFLAHMHMHRETNKSLQEKRVRGRSHSPEGLYDLTPLMVNFLRKHEIYICILYHFFTLRWCSYLKSLHMEDKDRFIVLSHGWPLMTMTADDLGMPGARASAAFTYFAWNVSGSAPDKLKEIYRWLSARLQ